MPSADPPINIATQRVRPHVALEVPLVAGARAPRAQPVGVGLPELGAPPPDRLIAHRDTTCKHQLLDLTKAQREPEVQPHAVVDYLDRVAVALLRRRYGAHPTDPPRSPTLTNVTVPAVDTRGATVVAAHWRHEVADYPLSGDQANKIIAATPGLMSIGGYRDNDVIVEVFDTGSAVSVAARNGVPGAG